MAASWAILEASQEPCWAMGSHLGGYETARRAILAIVVPSGGHLGLKKRRDMTQDLAGHGTGDSGREAPGLQL